jgi:hypothetical protein
MTTICKKAAQDFHRAVSKVFDSVKSVTVWSANIRKLAKDHKGYGSAASNSAGLKIVPLLAPSTFIAPYFHYLIQTRTCIHS